MASNQFLVWGNGFKKDGSSHLRQRKSKLLGFNKKVDNVYIKDDCVISISNGQIYKEGIFNFEKSEDETLNKSRLNNSLQSSGLINLYSQSGMKMTTEEVVADLSIGENHILIRTLKGSVYAWGDNYYGQLGLGNGFIAKVYEPQEVKIKDIKEIYAYKNNSFAIDSLGKLWVWGSCEYLGNNFKGNAFKPVNILSQLIISKIQFLDERMIIVGTEDLNVIGKDTSDEGQNKLDKDEDTNSEKNNLFEDSNMKFNQLLKVMNKLNIDIGTILGKLTFKGSENSSDDKGPVISEGEAEQRMLMNIRNKVLADQNMIKTKGFDQMWNEIIGIINKQNFENSKAYAKSGPLPIDESIELFMSLMTNMMSGNYNDLNCKKMLDSFSNNEKEINRMISDIKKTDIMVDRNIKDLADNVKVLLDYFLKYKKLEMLIHKMSAHQFIMRSYHFQNVFDALKYVLDQNEDVEKKLYIIEKAFSNLRFLIEKTNSSFEGLENVFDNLSNFNFNTENDKDNIIEKFLHKHIIESTFYIRDLWLLLIQNVEIHRKAKEKEEQLIKVVDRYKELNAIQFYLNSVSFSNAFKFKPCNNNNKNINLIKELKTRITLLITEIDGAITRLEAFIKKVLEEPNDLLSKVKSI
jgi:hypothetical protein